MKQDRKNRVVKVRVSDKLYQEVSKQTSCVSAYIRSLLETAASTAAQ